MLAAIILAAGKSERMGRPKALLPIRGRTFLENILDAISKSPITHTVVVVGHHHEEIQARVSLPAVVHNPDYEKGMITSIQAGIRALPEDAVGSFLFLVDHPIVDSGAIEALAAHAASDRIVLPVYQGRRGHPAYFGKQILAELLTLPATQGANTVVRKDPKRVVEVVVNAPGVLVDIDTPEQYEKLSEPQV